jgi:hypothetical protein
VSGPDAAGESDPKAARPRSMVFRKRYNAPMPAEQARRQSEVVQSAWRHFRGAEPVIAFLNTRHDTLEAQPLRLAIESDEGLRRVETLLEQMSLQA